MTAADALETGTRAGRRHLLVPIMPTPNGRFHLGHIAGPYLKMDLIARQLRRRGDIARIVTGTDCYESYVLRKAAEDQLDPAEVCAVYHGLIEADLGSLGIELDAMISPLSEAWSTRYHRTHVDWVRRLRESDAVVTAKERVLFSPGSGRYAIGCWLSGRCPDCGSGVGSYFCEECGTHFRPEDVLDPRGPGLAEPLHWREVTSLFLRVPEPHRLLAELERMFVPARFRAIAERFLNRNGRLLRLTVPDEWGVPLGEATSGAPRSLFSYTALLPYSLLCGEVYGDLSGSGANAFAAGSDVVTASSFGIDNAVPMLVGAVGGALADPSVKPFDHFLINHFYQLEGDKFSTSRNHAIWVSDIVRNPAISSDMVRYYLAKVNPDGGTRSLDVDHFVSTVNEDLVHGIGRRTRVELSRLDSRELLPGAPSEQLLRRLRAALQEQERAFDLAEFSAEGVVRVLLCWAGDPPSGSAGADDVYWWLKGLSLLAWPLLPDFGESLWGALGGSGVPAVQGFFTPTSVGRMRRAPCFLPIGRADIESCLPRSLRGEDRSNVGRLTGKRRSTR